MPIYNDYIGPTTIPHIRHEVANGEITTLEKKWFKEKPTYTFPLKRSTTITDEFCDVAGGQGCCKVKNENGEEHDFWVAKNADQFIDEVKRAIARAPS